MLKWLGRWIDRLFAVAGAFAFSQVPVFIQQYTQRLAGHAAELQFQIQLMTNAALQSNMELSQYIQKFLVSSDSVFVRQGELLNGMLIRSQTLTDGLGALNHASVFTRPFVFLRYWNGDIVYETFKTFQIGVLFNVEGLVYALVGIVFGYSVFRAIYFLGRLVRKLF